MKKFYTKIENIVFNDDNVIIECEKKNLKMRIIDGSVDIKIFTNDNDEVGYTILENNDNICVFYESKENNYFIPKKIIIQTKYNLISESEDSETII